MAESFQSTVITTNTTTTILNGIGANGSPSSQGDLHTITIGAPGAAGGSVVVFDSVTGSGKTVANIAVGAAALTPVSIVLDISLANGLTVVTSGMTTPNVTVTWK
jgi:hypothetical protein